jgi:hypothetical protein
LVIGDAGVGKTRLVAEGMAWAARVFGDPRLGGGTSAGAV